MLDAYRDVGKAVCSNKLSEGFQDYFDGLALSDDGLPSAALQAEFRDSKRPAKRRKVNAQPGSVVQDDQWVDPLVLASLMFTLTFVGEDEGVRKAQVATSSVRPVEVLDPSGGGIHPLRSIRMTTPRRQFETLVSLGSGVNERTRSILRHLLLVQPFSRTKYAKLDCKLTQAVQSDGALHHQLEVRVLFKNSRNMGEYTTDRHTTQMLEVLFAESHLGFSAAISPRDFYESVHVPSQEGEEAVQAAEMSVEGLSSKLYPFQKRTTAWLLQREGVNLNSESIEIPKPKSHHGFLEVQDIEGRKCYVNPWLGAVTTHTYVIEGPHTQVRGGLLAEEMGLGKTVEIVALILLHRRRLIESKPNNGDDLIKSKGTLIISPLSIQQQWMSEIQMHAPDLRVMIYEGVKSMGKKSSEKEMIDILLCYDIVLCSYTVLSAEIHYAKAGPDRSLRHAKQYEKRTSPLVQIDWWRCVLDECQMVESGVNQAAQTANQIPRQNAWAVSGTPMKKDSKDVFGLLTYLRLQPYCYSQGLFERLITKYKEVFKDLFGTIALRHTKDQIKADLQLPRQNRVVINMPFTPVEENHYSNMYQSMCDECGLSLEGAPLEDDWDPDEPVIVDKMRTWLARLRQTVLHPEVGERNRRALGQSQGPLRTVEEVLRVMTDQNEVSLRTEERAWLVSKLKRGQVLEQSKKTQDALEIWLSVLEYSARSVDECRKDLREETEKEQQDAILRKVKEEPDGSGNDSADDEIDEENKQQTRLGSLRNRLRTSLEVLHMATFFVGNGYFQLKTDETSVQPDSDRFQELEKMEVETYEKAKSMRKEMLMETLSRATKFMSKIQKRELTPIPKLKELMPGGMESRNIMDKAEVLLEIINAQAEKIEDWRASTIKLLLKPLIDQEEAELQGDEYETSTKEQDEQYVYMEALRAVVADRADYLSGLENGLIKRDMAIALGQAHSGEGASPELMIKLLEQRQALAPKPQLGYVRGVILELRGLRTDLERYQSSRVNHEVAIITSALNSLQSDLTKQTKAVAELEKEVDLFRDCMNARLEFYRQLQIISDGVAPFEEELSEEAIQRLIDSMKKTESSLEAKINSFKSRARYLEHLKSESNTEEGPKKCIICQETIEVGVLLSCGHTFDAECIKHWYGTHKSCPMCKKKLSRNDFHSITYKPSELTAQEETNHMQPSPASITDADDKPSTSIYSNITTATLNDIKNTDLPGSISFGTKIDTLARHLIWLRTSDPGSKSIIFSQFRDFLDILARAFRRFKIGFSTIDDKRSGIERFKKDSSVEVFFLHAKAHASGLNLVNATHVFLCEPLINTALELQAIARVHRIGQHSQTTVYMYLVEDTVEKAIYDISVKRRMEHISRANGQEARRGKEGLGEEDIEKANSMEMQDASAVKMLTSGRGGGEMVGKGDLWQCLFGARATGRTKVSEDARRMVAGFLGAEAAEERALESRGGPG